MTPNPEIVKPVHPLCELKDVVKTYKSSETVCPLNGVSLSCAAGDFVSIEGPSGMGKSTLLYLLGGLLQADGGEIWVDAVNLQNMTERDLTILRATKIGFIFQETYLFQALTVNENLMFTLKLVNKYLKDKWGPGHMKDKVETWLVKLGLEDRRDFLPHQLSVGQRRRLLVGRALITEPLLLLADEPTNDLDDAWAGEVVKLLQSVPARGGAVVMVTHNMFWAGQAQRRYALNHGVLTGK